jgi:hypothetical protein
MQARDKSSLTRVTISLKMIGDRFERRFRALNEAAHHVRPALRSAALG